ncbi:MAG: GNAT family N-acetyltransferase [Idiomarina sp.]
MIWETRSFQELDIQTLYAILKIRQEVFIVEQTCPYMDADGLDQQAQHLFARSDTGKLLAYARIFLPTDDKPYSRIGRVLSAGNKRGSGLGKQLMQRSLDYLLEHAPLQPVRLSAQTYLKDFYTSFGFVEIGDEYLEDDIPHVDMERAA